MTRSIRPGSGAFVALMASLMTLSAMATDINLPAIPVTAAALDASLTSAQLTVTLFFAGFALGQLIWGPLSDARGRKPAMLVGIVTFELATIGCALAPGIEMLLLCRAVQGLGAAAAAVLARAVIRDLFDGPQMARVMSLALAAFITGPIVAPSIGAVILAVASWRWIFGFLAIYGGVLLLLAALFLDESLRTRNPAALHPARVAGAFVAVFGHADSRPWAIAVTLTFTTLVVYLTNAPAVLMQGYGMSPSTFGVAFAVVAVFAAAGNLLNVRLVRFMSLPRVIRLGVMAALAIGLGNLALAVAGWGGAWLLIFGLGLFFVCFGLVVSNSITLALHPHGAIAGSAVAALGFTHTVIPAVIASVVAALYDGTPRSMLLVLPVLMLVSWLILPRRFVT